MSKQPYKTVLYALVAAKPCLRCGKKFEAEHRFNRICPKCHVLNTQVQRRPPKAPHVKDFNE